MNGEDRRRPEETQPPQPQLQGVVIISLPPPDDPSKGKTITAFTFSDSPSPLPPVPPHPSPPRRRLRLSPRRAVAGLFVAAVVSASLWLCLFSEAPYQLLSSSREEPERQEKKSFLLPLYPKNRTWWEPPEVRLGSARVAGTTKHMKRAQSLKSSSRGNSSAVFTLRGNVLDGQYYTSIFVGNPPRPYFLDVDTGSDLTWIQCDAPCTSCAKGPHPLYKPLKERIVPSKDNLCIELQRNHNLGYCDSCHQCDYEIEYADRSSSMGVLARDDMFLTTKGDMAKLSFVFGCAYDQQGELSASPAKTDGIIGLSSASVSLPSQLASQGVISNVVGHCISSETHGGGYLFLGDDYVPFWGVTYVPARSGLVNYYSAEVLKITYGQQHLSGGKRSGNSAQLVFDTGSTYTYFPNDIYTKLVASLKDVAPAFQLDDTNPAAQLCWQADSPVRSVKDVEQFFQPIKLDFGNKWWEMGKVFTIPPEGYLHINDKAQVCLGILNGSEVLGGSTIILGDISLRGKLIVYDNILRKIGWIQSDCAKPQRPRGFPFFL